MVSTTRTARKLFDACETDQILQMTEFVRRLPSRARRTARALLLIIPLAGVSLAVADESLPSVTQFTRVIQDPGGRPDALQLAIVTYAGGDDAAKVSVDLVGAVHIADRAFYQTLNERFQEYDALLYELIVPGEAAELPLHAASGSVVSGLQVGMKNMLGLAFQLEEIDYGAANFVHADLTSEALAERMAERGESLYVYLFRLLVASIEESSRDPFGTKRARRLSDSSGAAPGNALKVAMAYELADAAAAGEILAGPDGSALIEARNEHAIRVLQEQLREGARRVGVFYGVAHMPDIERRLVRDLALTRVGIEWIDAWRLDGGNTDSQPDDSGATPR